MAQPAPINKGQSVTPALLEWLKDHHASEKVISTIQQRYEFGLNKYGQPLMTQDGRDTFRDAQEEAADLLQYLYKATLQELKDPFNVQELEEILAYCQQLLLKLK